MKVARHKSHILCDSIYLKNKEVNPWRQSRPLIAKSGGEGGLGSDRWVQDFLDDTIVLKLGGGDGCTTL